MKEAEEYSIAILLACYNRKEKTLAFLESLTTPDFFKRLNADIYLLDDASTDGLADEVNSKYPKVNVVTGSGNLFWAGGMRTIWKHAQAKKQYDIFMLFNDDVVLFEDALQRLFETYRAYKREGVILIGSTLSPKTNTISYGGHSLYSMKHSAHFVINPSDFEPIPCQLGNANIMMIDNATVQTIGIFDEVYIHAVADYDYTLRAYKNEIKVLVAPGFYGRCEDDHGVNWLSGKHTLRERINYLYSPKGLAYREYLVYIKKHFPRDYMEAFTKLWLKTFFPIIWDTFKKKEESNQA